MNVRMWEHAATQANAALLRERGAVLVGPEEGELAEGEWGMGRMGEPPAIARSALAALPARGAGTLAGRAVLVTAGGTREPIDGVRFLGNRSSGRMGAALRRGGRRARAPGHDPARQRGVRPASGESWSGRDGRRPRTRGARAGRPAPTSC